jgi:hypothetical protein
MMKRYQPDPNNPPQLIKSDLARIDRMTDQDIDCSDIPELGDEFFTKALVPNKATSKQDTYVVINLLPPERIEWLRQQSRRVAEVFRAHRKPKP